MADSAGAALTTGDEDPSHSAVPRELPSTLLIPPPPTSGSRASRRAAAAAAVGGGGRGGRRKAVAPALAPAPDGAGGSRTDRLVEAVRVVGRNVDAGVAGADILELAMAKGPMFAWLSYWPENGYPKEDQPY
ncbi:uncharacterized protein LOC133902946 [Phragmites australis]|uniref:uncharacterized protein LOC133902946 n=1 Tax=Phragmites australis TaxID=29695 RepID=UPI002D769DD4|nr:uncharacterized protein LOC133902946 [Phragmites australis]